MLIKIQSIDQVYTRTSKLGVNHTYQRSKTQLLLRCDCCLKEFFRDLSKMNKRRLHEDYSHVCKNCNQKQFAQKKSAQKRKLWNLPVDSDQNITNF